MKRKTKWAETSSSRLKPVYLASSEKVPESTGSSRLELACGSLQAKQHPEFWVSHLNVRFKWENLASSEYSFVQSRTSRVLPLFHPKTQFSNPQFAKTSSRKCLWIKIASIHLNKHESSTKNNNSPLFTKIIRFSQNTNITTNFSTNP